MKFQFIIDLSAQQYNKFLKEKSFTSYKQEALWSTQADVEEVFYVGAVAKKKLVGVAKVEVKRKKKDIYFNIPGGYLLDYNDKDLLFFFTKHMYILAKRRKAYTIRFDFISNEENILQSIKEAGYRPYEKPGSCSRISLKDNRKFLTTRHFKNLLTAKSIEKEGLFFETITTKAGCDKLYETMNHWSLKLEYNLYDLLKIYKKRIVIIVEKLDLIFYLNYLRECYAKENDVVTIEELIEECGDNYVLGIAVILLPASKENAFCISMKDNGSFPQLDVSNQLLLETIKVGITNKYNGIIHLSPTIFKDATLSTHKYELVVRNWKHYIYKIKLFS